MKNYHDCSFNRRNWILSNGDRLKLSAEETIVILMIDLMSECRQTITMDLLARKCVTSIENIDRILASLNAKGILKMIPNGFDMSFDIDAIFDYNSAELEVSDLYELFESEFGRVLSRNEVNTISEWLRIYDHDAIVNALREAVIARKKSISYVDRILANGQEEN